MDKHWQHMQTCNEAEGLHSRRNLIRVATSIWIIFLMYSLLTFKDPNCLHGASRQSCEILS